MKISEDAVKENEMRDRAIARTFMIALIFLISGATLFFKSNADEKFTDAVSVCTAAKPFSERQCRIFLKLQPHEQALVEEVLAMPNFNLKNPEAKNQ